MVKLSEKKFLAVFSHLRDEANIALIWAICVGIIKPNCIWAKVNEKACKILPATAFWFPHQRWLGAVPVGRHEAGGMHVCRSDLTGAHAGFPVLAKVTRGSLHTCLLEACGAPLLTASRDYCHLSPPSPRRDTCCAAQRGLQHPWSSSSPACPIQGFQGRARATLPRMVPHKESHSRSASRAEPGCVRVMCRYPSRRVFLTCFQSPKSPHISTWVASRQPCCCGLSQGRWERCSGSLTPFF